MSDTWDKFEVTVEDRTYRVPIKFKDITLGFLSGFACIKEARQWKDVSEVPMNSVIRDVNGKRTEVITRAHFDGMTLWINDRSAGIVFEQCVMLNGEKCGIVVSVNEEQKG